MSLRPLVVALCALSLPLSGQQEPFEVILGLESGDRFGDAMALAGDVDDDGVVDLVIGAPKTDLAGDRRGRVVVISGADHTLLHVFEGTQDLHEFGLAVDGAGDVDDDGHADVIVGEPWPYASAAAPGKAYVFSGLDGSLLALHGRHDGARPGAAGAHPATPHGTRRRHRHRRRLAHGCARGLQLRHPVLGRGPGRAVRLRGEQRRQRDDAVARYSSCPSSRWTGSP